MESKRSIDMELDLLFAAWCDDREAGSPRPLSEWIERYPQHRDLLVRWAADLPVLDQKAPFRYETPEEARALTIGRSVVAEMRTRYSAPLRGLYEAEGMTARNLAQQVGVGITTIAKLHQRLLTFASIPDELIRRLADSLDTSVSQVTDYLRRTPTLSTGASYRSREVPQVSSQEEFAEAVKTARDMTEEQKRFWLSQSAAISEP